MNVNRLKILADIIERSQPAFFSIHMYKVDDTYRGGIAGYAVATAISLEPEWINQYAGEPCTYDDLAENNMLCEVAQKYLEIDDSLAHTLFKKEYKEHVTPDKAAQIIRNLIVMNCM